jgi:hypothetical protein
MAFRVASGQVRIHAKIEDDAVAPAILRQVGDAVSDRVLRRRRMNPVAVQGDRPAIETLQSEEDAGKLGPAGTH